jgi:hypothetical protein
VISMASHLEQFAGVDRVVYFEFFFLVKPFRDGSPVQRTARRLDRKNNFHALESINTPKGNGRDRRRVPRSPLKFDFC